MDYFKYVDYTCLKPTATIRDIEKICDEAMKYHVATVCVNPYYVPLVAGILKDSTIGVTAVVGFPLGANTTRVKTLEAIEAIDTNNVAPITSSIENTFLFFISLITIMDLLNIL